jgi:hypothetical protein|tara:strand:- start:942 stop:1223 length:282 start_codon:yes stop_codon:yes gene_type:complete
MNNIKKLNGIKEVTPYLSSFMSTFMVRYGNTLSDGHGYTTYVKALDADEAFDTVTKAIKSDDMLVKNVIGAGDENFGIVDWKKDVAIDVGFGF